MKISQLNSLWALRIFGNTIRVNLIRLQYFMYPMNRVFKEYPDPFAFIDAILVYFKSKEEQEEHLRIVLSILKRSCLINSLSANSGCSRLCFWAMLFLRTKLRLIVRRLRLLLNDLVLDGELDDEDDLIGGASQT